MAAEIKVRSDLLKIVEDLKKIQKASEQMTKSLKELNEGIGDDLDRDTKKVETGLNRLRQLGRRVADQLRSDFKTLFSANALASGLQLNNQFRGTIKETVALSDAIRKMGNRFGIAGTDFSKFQNTLTNGLGKVGLSSEAAVRTMQGLLETPVKGQEALLEYSKTAGQLASLSGQAGREGDIAKGIARVIQARGGDPNDVGQMRGVAEDLRRARNATGKGPAELLGSMEDLFTNMSEDMRKRISTRGLTNLAAAGAVSGPNSTKFLEEFLGKSPIARKAMEAQGFKDIFNDQGLDVEKFRKASGDILGRIGEDPRLAAQTLGLSEEAAEGFIRLARSLDQVKTAQDQIRSSTGSVEQQYRQSLSMSEAFGASLNRLKGYISGALSPATQGLTNMLGDMSQSDAGAATVAGGAAIAAAVLTSKGLSGLGKAAGVGGLAKGAAVEAITGRQVVPVYVTNAAEIGAGAAGMGGLGGKAGKIAGAAGGAGIALAAGMAVGGALNQLIDTSTQGRTAEGFEGSAVERLIFKLEQLLGTKNAKAIEQSLKVTVQSKDKDLKTEVKPSRGRAQ